MTGAGSAATTWLGLVGDLSVLMVVGGFAGECGRGVKSLICGDRLDSGGFASSSSLLRSDGEAANGVVIIPLRFEDIAESGGSELSSSLILGSGILVSDCRYRTTTDAGGSALSRFKSRKDLCVCAVCALCHGDIAR